MDRIIIGIHGLNNKPSLSILKKWWKLALLQGLKESWQPCIDFRFDLLYWADLLYPRPLDPLINHPENPLFVRHPYKKVPPAIHVNNEPFRRFTLDSVEKMSEKFFQSKLFHQNLSDISDKFIHHRFQDLYRYFHNETGIHDAKHKSVRDVILDRFYQLLHRYRHKKIMIIAHSMGSIIAYDALSRMNHKTIDLLLTAGSPLGQPNIINKLSGEDSAYTAGRTPECVQRWVNLSDIHDVIAMNYALKDDFAPNSRRVSPEDRVVKNAYEWEREPNAHNVYGYLQTPECAQVVDEFLKYERSRLSVKTARIVFALKERIFRKTEKMRATCPSRIEKGLKKVPKEDKLEQKIDRQLEHIVRKPDGSS